jgi:hypothetical protein
VVDLFPPQEFAAIMMIMITINQNHHLLKIDFFSFPSLAAKIVPPLFFQSNLTQVPQACPF